MTEVSVHKMVPAAMVSLREKVQAWRAKKKHRRMPEELWTEAVGLALKYGVHPVSKNVEVSYTRLKKLVDGKDEKCLARQSPQKFVQISPAKSRSASGSRLEISRPDVVFQSKTWIYKWHQKSRRCFWACANDPDYAAHADSGGGAHCWRTGDYPHSIKFFF